jgi:nicotinate-nucleotide adenylyltransferase
VKLGLFGGTFDPPHIGHRIVAQDVLAALRLDRIVFIPAARPPHKRRPDMAPPALRLTMLRAAIAADDRFDSDDLELHRTGPSYTVDTLAAYRERIPDAALHLVVGADQFAELDTWHDTARVRTLATLCVMTRAGEGADAHVDRVAPGDNVIDVPVTRIDISSSEIRRRVHAGEPIRYLVPAAVEALIRENGLYR